MRFRTRGPAVGSLPTGLVSCIAGSVIGAALTVRAADDAAATPPAAAGRPRAVSLADRPDRGPADDEAVDRGSGRSRSPGGRSTALRDALRAAVANADTLHGERLAAALAESPNDPAVRGAAGQLRRGARWVDYDTLVAEARSDRRLAEYRRRRTAAEPSVVGQLALADWCRAQRLPAQERAHLAAVVDLDPDHAAARQRLGDIREGDRWVPAEEASQRRDDAAATAEAIRRHRRALESLGRQLGAGTMAHDDGVARLARFRSPAGIVAMEAFLSTVNEPAARCVVAALADDDSPAASASLARHAVAARWPEVRREAATQLARRDLQASVPLLLEAFASPWKGGFEVAHAPDGSILCRQTVVSDAPDAVRIGVHDHLVVAGADPGAAAGEAARQAALTIAERAAGRDAINARIDAGNDAIAAVLQVVTGESIGADPEAWSGWWQSRSETYSSGPRPIETSYTWSSSYAAPRSTARIETRPPMQCECLAGGTEVWTDTGPVAIDRIRPGDLVVVQDPWSGVLSLEPVLRTTARPPERLLTVRAGGATIRATGGHPFWVVGKGWTIARDLHVGDRLHGLDGAVAIESIDEEESPSRAFNLVVAGSHDYFCGPRKVISHDNSPRLHAAHPLPGLVE